MIVSRSLGNDLPLVAIAIAALLYALGGSRRLRAVPARRRAASRDPRAWLFAAALAASVGALGEPLDRYADELFWAHMLQHVLLVVAVAPLLVLAAPWNRLWRAVPLRWRRPVARGLAQARWSAPLRLLARGLGRPLPAFALFNGVFVAWHVPWLYDAAVEHEALHALEHVLFVGLAVLLWAQVIGSPPFRPRLAYPGRIGLLVGTLAIGWMLAIVLALSTTPYYPAYAALTHRPAGISALVDQQLGGGIMWMIGSFPYALAVFVFVYRWLADDAGLPGGRRLRRAPGRLAGEH